ncbi:P-loop containing nucleoside triphosphate hydrolases superfamily protein isoform 1 [Hibiscus syriacus]|uniref:P-loop containing nucleoside triphosphate hydrolases superfamily protein isoform 1 n=1 Tax=Hibiscus syriacus TaxID=106335 RepID=A0A6A2WPS9_HIBSY|nr:P-loop containing nucleoside triphosphate hydrolases superfamily protein isoform 1 [Hibiscus syriacus]
MSLISLSNPTGALGTVCSFLVKVVVLSSVSITNADFSSNLLQAPVQSPTLAAEGAPAVSDLPSPSNLPLVYRPHRRHLSPRSAPTLLAPTLPPLRCPLIIASHPPISSRLSKPLMKRSALLPPGVDLPNIAPAQISPGLISAGLAQPPLSPEGSSCCKPGSILKRGTHACHCVCPIKLELLLLNVSQNANWNAFLVELTSQLDLLPDQEGQRRFARNLPRTADAVAQAGSFPHPSSTRFLQYEEFKEATNNFTPSSILGEGGFGRVFKGVLTDGTAVAIKRLTNGGPEGDKDFLVEVEMLSKLHHRNHVKLVGYYSSCESSQNLLCYELVPNGSLEAWLHGPLGVKCPLDWDTRMKIALDAARGLAYLHEDSQPCVIHQDFKASNILLENNFHAKVADFGLAKQAPEGRTNYLSTRLWSCTIELLTGRTPAEMLSHRNRRTSSPGLGGQYPKEDFIRVCTIAAACVAHEACQRPAMGEVVQSLKMVQRITEYQDSASTIYNNRPNRRHSSTTFESEETSSMFSSGHFSGLGAFENDISRTAVSSEDLHEGR